MCYLCKPTPRQKACETALAEAIKVWRGKGNNRGAHKCYRRDFTKPPTRAKLPRVPLGTETLGDGLWTDAELRERLP